MKKDIEWLKKEIEEYLEYEGVRDARIALKSVLGYIDQLDEPKLTQDQVDKYLYERNFVAVDAMMVVQTGMQNKVVVEKPVIPKFVADYIEKWEHEGLTIYEWFSFGNNDVDEDVNKWLYDNTMEENRRREYLLINAIRNGYEVEKEKKYYVAFEDINLLYVTRVEVCGENGKLNYSSESSTENAMKFIDKEKASSLAYFLGAIVVEATQ